MQVKIGEITMSFKMEEGIQRCTAMRKNALVLDIIQGKTAVSEASRATTCRPRKWRNRFALPSSAWRTP